MAVITTDSSTAVIPTTEVISDSIAAKVTTANNRIAEVSTNTYVLQSAAGSAFSAANGLPIWLGTAIDDAVVSGTVDVNQLVTDLQTAFDNLDTGVTQQIGAVQTDLLSTNTKLDSNVSRLDDDVAGVLSLANTKVTTTEASAVALAAMDVEFNTPNVIANSWLLNLLNTTATAVDTRATEIVALTSSFNDSVVDIQVNADITNTRITDAGIGADGTLTAGAYAGQTLVAQSNTIKAELIVEQGIRVGNYIWNGVEPLQIGMKRYIDDTLAEPFISTNLEVYTGGILLWQVADERPWAAGASNMVTDPDTGAVTGWNYTAGSSASTFAVAADSFFIESSSVPGYKPFTVDATAGTVSFNGVVDFTATNVANGLPGTTTINGGNITTGMIKSSDGGTYFDLTNNILQINNGIITSGAINGASITGGRISGSVIEAAVIRASYLDLDGDLELLTNFYLATSTLLENIPQSAIDEGRYRVYSSEEDTDAVPIYIGDSLQYYRIPSVSSIVEPTISQHSVTGGTEVFSVTTSYAVANLGANSKLVKRAITTDLPISWTAPAVPYPATLDVNMFVLGYSLFTQVVTDYGSLNINGGVFGSATIVNDTEGTVTSSYTYDGIVLTLQITAVDDGSGYGGIVYIKTIEVTLPPGGLFTGGFGGVSLSGDGRLIYAFMPIENGSEVSMRIDGGIINNLI